MKINFDAPKNWLNVEECDGVQPAKRGANSWSQQVKTLVALGDYENALRFLPPDSFDRETQNCRAVCMMRLGRFEEAIAILRTVSVNWSSVTLRVDVPRYIHLNFATALAFGGEPSGALDVLNEIHANDDPVAREIKSAIDAWVAGMNWFRRLDWKMNRIAPQTRPTPPTVVLGRFGWDLGDESSN